MMEKKATTPILDEVTEKATVTKNIVLEGTSILRAEKVTSTFKVVRELNPKTMQPMKVVSKTLIDEQIEPLEFPLVEVTTEELAIYRRNRISSFVLKCDGKFYYSAIPDNISFVSSSILGEHQCSPSGSVCNRLSAASDEDGGCAKVRDRSSCIERYPWIVSGYETFSTRHDSFVVTSCQHYEKCPPRKVRTATEINNARLALAQFVWDDVTTLAEVRERKAKNKGKIGNI